MRTLFLSLAVLSAGCQWFAITPRPPDCTNGRADGLETDVDCGGDDCPGCAVGRICLDEGDCESGSCALNVCLAPTCSDGIRNGGEMAADCGGPCAPCERGDAGPACGDGGCVTPTCSDGQQNGAETDVDCGGGACGPCMTGQGCARTSDCAAGVCLNGTCGSLCGGPLLACNLACVDPRVDRDNCGGCGVVCGAGRACLASQCTLVCQGGTRECAGQCVDVRSNPLHCGGCGAPCPAGQLCVGGGCVPPCPMGQVLCGGACVSTARDPLHCGGCNQPCPMGSACVGGQCVTGCAAPLETCDGGARCVDPRNDPDHCGGCDQPCAMLPQAFPACAARACIIGACQPGFLDCNGVAADGCEANLLTSSQHCGRCDAPCGMAETCVGGQCCGPLPPGTYQMTCTGCQACGGVLQCLCEDMMMVPRPAMFPLNPPCPALFNCNGNLQCSAC